MTQIAVSAGSSASFTLAAGSRVLIAGQGTYRIGPRGTSARPTVDELIDNSTNIGPYEDSCTVQIWSTGATTYELVLPSDVLDQTGRPIEGAALRALVSGAGKLVGADVVAPQSAPIAAVGSAGALTGAYYYGVAYLLDDGTVTPPWSGTATVVNPAGQQVNLTNIPVSASPRVVGRVLLRTAAGAVDPKAYFVLATINDNTTTTYADNTADGSLGSPANWLGTSGGLLTTSSGVVMQGLAAESQSLAIGGGGADAGYASLALCYGALASVTIGRRNVAAGTYALTTLTTGYENTAVGVHAGQNLLTGASNVFVGYTAGFNSNGTANFNVALGTGALAATASGIGQQNVALGYRALYAINTADQCVAVGPFAGQFANASRQLYIDTAGSGRANLAATQNDGLIYGEIPNSGNVQTQRLNLNGSVRLGSSTSPTVANLPAAAAGLQGCRRYVTDANATLTAGIGTVVAAGGANCVPVFCDGAAWRIG